MPIEAAVYLVLALTVANLAVAGWAVVLAKKRRRERGKS